MEAFTGLALRDLAALCTSALFEWKGNIMTKDELKQKLREGKTIDRLMVFRRGEDCWIYKTSFFKPGDTILYIPDIEENDLPIHEVLAGDTERIDRVAALCYTGDDFLQQCNGDREKAEHLFWLCDWQHPVSVMDDLISLEEDGMAKKYKVTITETLKRVVEVEAKDEMDAIQQVSDGWRDSKYILNADDFVDVDFNTELVVEE